MKPDGFVFEPARGKCTRTPKFKRGIRKGSIHLVHGQFPVVEIALFDRFVQGTLLALLHRQLQIAHRSLQKIRHIFGNKF